MDSVKDGNEASGRGPESLPVTMSHTAFTPAPGMRLRDYVLVDRIGQGGMGQVYRARQSHLDRMAAIKFLPPLSNQDDEQVARFRQEMRAIGKLPSHPNIIAAHDAGRESGVHFLVMEYVDGVDVGRILKAHRRLAVTDACEIIRQAALGLAFIAENGMVHRDIKPSNLLLSTSGQVKILDLGIARLREVGDEEGLTRQDVAMGTPGYMAPEQWRDSHRVDIRADVYALGCTLFHLLTGRTPYSGSPNDQMYGHVVAETPSIEGVPEELARFVERMLAKIPDDRPPTPSEVARFLEPFCAGSDLTALLEDVADVSRSMPETAHNSATATSDPVRSEDSQADSARRRLFPWRAGMSSWRWTGHFVHRTALLSAVSAGIVILVAGAWSLRPGPGDSNATSERSAEENVVESRNPTALAPSAHPRIESMRVLHFRGEKVTNLGIIGEREETDLLVEDDVRVEATFDRPAYCYLVALNPDGAIQICSPEDETTPPTASAELRFPTDPSAYFGLTDGAGTQAFVLLASGKPAPSFQEWKARVGEIPWSASATAGVWEFDGKTSKRLPDTRGTIRKRLPKAIDEAFTFLKERDAAPVIHAIAFPVEDPVEE